ncbi:MAG: hypothetical protein O3A59_14530 [Nitrospirae bacterium]|nr:hypothetical protein [Nitrospirota bacterium]
MRLFTSKPDRLTGMYKQDVLQFLVTHFVDVEVSQQIAAEPSVNHRTLYDCGGEQKWWIQRNIDPLKEALQLWQQSCGRDRVIAS